MSAQWKGQCLCVSLKIAVTFEKVSGTPGDHGSHFENHYKDAFVSSSCLISPHPTALQFSGRCPHFSMHGSLYSWSSSASLVPSSWFWVAGGHAFKFSAPYSVLLVPSEMLKPTVPHVQRRCLLLSSRQSLNAFPGPLSRTRCRLYLQRLLCCRLAS